MASRKSKPEIPLVPETASEESNGVAAATEERKARKQKGKSAVHYAAVAANRETGRTECVLTKPTENQCRKAWVALPEFVRENYGVPEFWQCRKKG